MRENPDQNGPSFVAPMIVLTAAERWALTKALIAIKINGYPGEELDPEWTPEVEQALDTVIEKLNPNGYDNPA